MVSITAMARKFRKAADILDDLLADDTVTVGKVAAVRATLAPKKAKKTTYKYGGKHWTQTAAGKKKLALAVKRGHATRRQNNGGAK